jgi:hypothetical protein
MRENRTSGSEGGGIEANRFSQPLSSPCRGGDRGNAALKAKSFTRSMEPVYPSCNCVISAGGNPH